MGIPRSAAGWTIAVFGVLAVALGVLGLVRPDALLQLLGFEVLEDRAEGDYTRVYLAASSTAAVNVGAYYVLAAISEWRAFFGWTVPFRLLTVAVFAALVVTDVAPARFLAVGAWEGVGALATGLALWWDARRKDAAAV